MSETYSFTGTIPALVLTIMTGALSMISSCIIIYIIYKSEKKLSTIYHRIMCGISIADTVKCIAVIFATLPMPRELPEGVTDYGWKGARLGNVGTCQAQGFLFAFGSLTMYAYYTSLICFYTLTLGFKIHEDKIERFFEPVFHLFPIALALGVSISNLVQQLYGAISTRSFCSAPFYGENGEDKVRGRFRILSGFFLGFILICFIVIIWAVQRTHFLYTAPPNIIRRGGAYRHRNNSSSATLSLNPTKLIFIQASTYVVAFLLTLGVPFLLSFLNFNVRLHSIALFCNICQGLFNALIFVSHKVYNYRRINQNKSIWQVVEMLFRGDAQDDIYISRISFVSRDINDTRLQRQEDRELMERNQDEDSSSIQNNDDGGHKHPNNDVEFYLIPAMFPIQAVNEDQEELDDSLICTLGNDEEERSNDFGSLSHNFQA